MTVSSHGPGSRPVFADPSGRRFRLLRIAGITATVVLAVCLGAVAVAVTGGPQAPFTRWAAPHGVAGTGGQPGQPGPGQPIGHNATVRDTPAGAGGTRATTPASAPTAGTALVPTASPLPSPPANRSGHTPSGHTQTRSPNPHASNGVR